MPEAVPEDEPIDSTLHELILHCEESLSTGQPAVLDTAKLSPETRAEFLRAEHCLRVLAELGGETTDTPVSLMNRELRDDDSNNRFGRFQIQRELGRGGHGVVFLALDNSLGRYVALKMPHPAILLDADLRLRFLREARAASVLEHANLVPVYEVGEEGAVCFIASAYCSGPTLGQWLKDRQTPVPYRLAAEMICGLAAGVHHAHQRGVLHRDIKPGNILLDVADSLSEDQFDTSSFVPRLTDFGLARLQDGGGEHTRTGAVLGTPCYMAPEQAAGRLRDIGVVTDVYALGCVLYELLTGRVPLRGENDADTLRRIVSDNVLPPRRSRPETPADLEAICLKCLERQPERRYASAAELEQDLRRYLAGEPTLARPLKWRQRLAKWARRRPMTASLVTMIALSAMSLVTVVAAYTQWLGAALAVSENRRIDAEEQHKEANQQREAYRQSEQRAESQRVATRRLLYAADIKLADQAYRAGKPRDALALLKRYLPADGEEDLREFAWHYLWYRCSQTQMTLRGHLGSVYYATYSRDGSLVATGGEDGTIRLWKAADGEPIRVLSAHYGDVNCLSFSPDGCRLASAGLDGTVRVSQILEDQEAQVLHVAVQEVYATQFSPSGRFLAAAGKEGLIWIWNTTTWQLEATIAAHSDFINALAFAPDGRLLASASDDGTVKLWNIDTFSRNSELLCRCGHVGSVAFSPNGRSLAAGYRDGSVMLWQVKNGLEEARWSAHADIVSSVAFSPDGEQILTSSRDATARLWNVRNRELLGNYYGHADRIWHSEFAPNGDRFVTCSADGTAKICKGVPAVEAQPWHYSDRGMVGFSNDGQMLVVSRDTPDGTALAIHQGNSRRTWRPSPAIDVAGITLARLGPAALAHDESNHWFFWTPTASWGQIDWKSPALDVSAMALSPQGDLAAVASERLDVISTANWASILSPDLSDQVVWLSFSADSRLLAAGCLDSSIHVWDLATRTELPLIKNPTSRATRQGTLSANGRYLAVSTDDGRVFVLDMPQGTVKYELSVPKGVAPMLVFSANAENLATAADDGSFFVWDLRTGRDLLGLETPYHSCSSLAFSIDGLQLAGSDRTGAVFRWRAEPLPVSSLMEQTDDPSSDFVSPLPQSQPRAVATLPFGEPGRAASLDLIGRFAEMTSYFKGYGRPTFDDREDDHGRLLGGIAFRQGAYDTLSDSIDLSDLAKASHDVELYARGRDNGAAFPMFYLRRPQSILKLPLGTFERAEIPVRDMGDTNLFEERCREVHRWAKRHGFAGGFPTFVDGTSGDQTLLGAVMIPTSQGEEVFLPSTVVWPNGPPRVNVPGKP